MLYSLLLFTILSLFQLNKVDKKELIGAWETSFPDGTHGLLIVTEDNFSLTYYKPNPADFLTTAGGKWVMKDENTVGLEWEFNTSNNELVGTNEEISIAYTNEELTFSDQKWKKVDNGQPGELNGAWLITGRELDGEMSKMTPGARKTMKILSGTKFQWIAYNSETGEFSGTGGGSYTTQDGKYTEKIEFFSRDNSRVGANLEFDYEIKNGQWHHSGKSSKGDPIYEIWSTRKDVGI